MRIQRSSIGAGLAALACLAFVSAPGVAHAQGGYTSPRNADVETRGVRQVKIEAGAGSLRVEGRTGLSQVRVRGIARASSRDRLGDIKLTAERRGDVVFIRAEIPDGNWNGWNSGNHYLGLDLVIEVPQSLSLDAEDGSGDASFINVGALSLTDGSGEVEIRGARGSVVVEDGSGTIDIDGVEGNLRVRDGSGDIRARNVTGDMTVDTDGSGEINVSGVGGTMRVANDGSGSIDVDRIGGNFIVESDGAGSIDYASVKGTVSIPQRRRDRRGR